MSDTKPSVLRVVDLRVAIDGVEILRGIDLEVKSGEVHAVMGPNGAGKSTLGNVLMGHPRYEVLGGSITLDGAELLGSSTWERARAGLFYAPQEPVEVPGVSIIDVLRESRAIDPRISRDETSLAALREEASRIGLDPALIERGLNVDCSGGEKKRIETLQLVASRPRIAILDEIDSGLDIDALRSVSLRIEAMTRGDGNGTSGAGLGVLVITHYRRLLNELHPDVIHVLIDGRIVDSGGMELADELERTGYGGREVHTGIDAPSLN